MQCEIALHNVKIISPEVVVSAIGYLPEGFFIFMKIKLKPVGANDCNGSQIFEGDIISDQKGNFYLVVYDSFYCCFARFPLKFYENESKNFDLFFDEYGLHKGNSEEYQIISKITNRPHDILQIFNS